MTHRQRLFAGFAAVAVTFAAGAPAQAAEQATDDTIGMETKTSKGLKFKLPADWPVEERNGVVAPIPPEEYYARKFSAIESRLKSVEQQTGSLELRLRVLEEKVKQQNQSGGLRSQEAAP